MIKYFSYFFLAILFCSCGNKSDIANSVKSLKDKQVEFEVGTVDTLRGAKIVVLLPDTGDCTTCAMQVYDWYVYKMDLDKNKLNCDVIYILNDSVKLNESVTDLMKCYKLHHINRLSAFYAENEILRDSPFTTFLLDESNRIKLVGSPIENEKLWKLYKRALREQRVWR